MGVFLLHSTRVQSTQSRVHEAGLVMPSGNQADFNFLYHCLSFSRLWDGCNQEPVLWPGRKEKHKGVKLRRDTTARSVRLSQRFQLATFTYVSMPELHHLAICRPFAGREQGRGELWMAVQLSNRHTQTDPLMINLLTVESQPKDICGAHHLL